VARSDEMYMMLDTKNVKNKKQSHCLRSLTGVKKG
jgi:hypothetical protein